MPSACAEANQYGARNGKLADNVIVALEATQLALNEIGIDRIGGLAQQAFPSSLPALLRGQPRKSSLRSPPGIAERSGHLLGKLVIEHHHARPRRTGAA